MSLLQTVTFRNYVQLFFWSKDSPGEYQGRFAELAYQNKNLPIALASTDRLAKITGVLKEEAKNVDIPQLTELTDVIKGILSPAK